MESQRETGGECDEDAAMDVWSHKEKLDVNEMRMLRWMCGVTKRDWR